MNEETKFPYMYCHKNLKNRPDMKRWRCRLKNSRKEKTATLSRKEILPTVKEYEAKIAELEDKLKANEEAYEKKEIVANLYESNRNWYIQDLQWTKRQRDERENLIYIGQAEFIKYEPHIQKDRSLGV